MLCSSSISHDAVFPQPVTVRPLSPPYSLISSDAVFPIDEHECENVDGVCAGINSNTSVCVISLDELIVSGPDLISSIVHDNLWQQLSVSEYN